MRETYQILTGSFTHGTDDYAAGDCIGSLITLATDDSVKPVRGQIESVTLFDAAKLDKDVNIVLFDDRPSATTFTNDAALDIADVDLQKIVGIFSCSTQKPFDDNEARTADTYSQRYTFACKSQVLYAAAMCVEGASHTGTTDLSLRVGVKAID